jgi:hypothetical protein
MKKIIIVASTLCALSSFPASADSTVVVETPGVVYYVENPRGYYVDADYPSARYERHSYGHNQYWAARQQEERDNRDNHEGRHDNGNHGYNNNGHR